MSEGKGSPFIARGSRVTVVSEAGREFAGVVVDGGPGALEGCDVFLLEEEVEALAPTRTKLSVREIYANGQGRIIV